MTTALGGLVFSGRELGFGLRRELGSSDHQRLMPTHSNGTGRARGLGIRAVAVFGAFRFGPVALTPPVVEFVGELFGKRVISFLVAFLLFPRSGVTRSFARFVLCAKCLL